MLAERPYRGYAGSGQSNMSSQHADSLTGGAHVFPPIVQMHSYETGAYSPGAPRSPLWYSAAAASGNRVDPGAGMAVRHATVRPTVGFRWAKDAVGGSSMSEWLSTFAARHIATMVATGWTFDGGLVWGQGETDAKTSGAAAAYFDRLGELFAMYRTAFPGLKICIVKLPAVYTPLSGTAPYIDEIRAAQVAYASSDPLCAIIDLDDFLNEQVDGVHWPASVQLVCGQRAYDALEAL